MPAHKKDTTPPNDPLSEAFGHRIADLRIARDWSPQELADRLQMSTKFLWKVEDGRQNVTLKTTAQVANAFEISLSQLLEGIDISGVPVGRRNYLKRD